MNNIYPELEQDFERLTDASMLWAGSNWEAQQGRFTQGNLHYSHKVIYWFESYADLFLAKQILQRLEHDYSVLFDNNLEHWVMTSSYATESWR